MAHTAGEFAFGVEPGRRAPYELRQARYHRLGELLAQRIRAVNGIDGRIARVLDVGVNDGRILRYLEPRLAGGRADLTGLDLFPRGMNAVYRREEWNLIRTDLEEGIPDLPSNAFDVVVCEQVLEHLHDHRPLLVDLERVLRPRGVAVVGVPIFPFGVHRLRPLAIRLVDAIVGPRVRSHVRAWSIRTLLRDLRSIGGMTVLDVRGFRIVSGGILRPLEFRRWWWRLNRRLGILLPGLCIEVQVTLEKDRAGVPTPAG